MPSIDYYFSLISPFTYLAGDRLERVAESRGAEIRYRPIDFIKVGTETGWTPPPKRHPSRIEYRRQDLIRLSERESRPINLAPAYWPTETLPASTTVVAAGLAGIDPGPLARIYLRKVWADEENIADADTVAKALSEAGISEDDIATHREEGERLYLEYTRDAPDSGVFGVPFYIVGSERFWGQDRLPDLDRHLSTLTQS